MLNITLVESMRNNLELILELLSVTMLKVAKEFPDVKFEHATGDPNERHISYNPFQFQKLFVVLTHILIC